MQKQRAALLTFAIQVIQTNVSLHCRRRDISQSHRFQQIAVIRLVRYHVTFHHLRIEHVPNF